MKSWIAGLFATFLSAACVLPSHTPSQPVPCSISDKTFRVDPQFSDEERKQILQGFEAWHTASKGAICFSEAGKPNKAWNFVVLRLDVQAELAPYDDDWEHHAAIYHPGVLPVAMDKSAAQLDAVIAHEAGHVLGYDHNSDTRSIMYYITGSLENGQLSAFDAREYLTKSR